MKIIFLSVLASTALTTFTSFPKFALKNESQINVIENEHLENHVRNVKNPVDFHGWEDEEPKKPINDFSDFIGKDLEKVELDPSIIGHLEESGYAPSEPEETNENEWDCEGNTFLYVEPSKLVRRTDNGVYYELSGVLYIDVEEWHMPSFQYIGLYDSTDANFFYESVTPVSSGTSAVNYKFYTRNGNAEGEMYIRYTWHHFSYEDPREETWPETIGTNGLVHKQDYDYQPTNSNVESTGPSDNSAKTAVRISTENFVLRGKIKNYNWWEKFINNLSGDDTDWYRFQINPTSTIVSLHLGAPNYHYTLSVYKYRCTVDSEMKDSHVEYLYSVPFANTVTYTLNPGTYYLKVTCPSSYVSSDNYIVNAMTYRDNDYFPLYSKSMRDYKAVVWENDYLSDRVTDRWSTNLFELKSQRTSNTYVACDKTGYFDPIFYENQTAMTLNKMVLDSVIYIWGSKELEFLAGTLQTLQTEIRKLRQQQLRHKQIVSDLVDIGNGVFDLVLSAVSISNSVSTKESISRTSIDEGNTFFGIGSSIVSMANAISDLILGSVPEALDYFGTSDSALSLLIGVADGLSGDPNGVLAIPVYGEYNRTSIYRNNQTYDAWIYRRSFVPYGKIYNSGTTNLIKNPTNKFRYDRITQYQWIGELVDYTYVDKKQYHGKITPFASMEDFKNYIHYDTIFDVYDLTMH